MTRLIALSLPFAFLADRTAAGCGSCTECATPSNADALLCSCFGSNPGEIGFGPSSVGVPLSGDVGETIVVEILIQTTAPVHAWGLDIAFPTELVRWDSTRVGDLTVGSHFFGANLRANGAGLRLGGAQDTEIPAGVTGSLAVNYFTVIEAGCGALCVDELFDDISLASGHWDCVPNDPTGAEEPELSSWGRVKIRYR